MRSMICRSAELVFCSKFNEYITKNWYEESKKMFHCHNLFKDGFVAFSVSNCYLSKCSPIDYWTPRNKRQFNSNKILRCHLIFFSNAVWDISKIVTPQCVKSCHPPGSVNRIHDDVIKWNHFCITCPLWEESTGHWWIPLTNPVMRSFDVFFDLCLNKRDAGDFRRHRAHYNVTVL